VEAAFRGRASVILSRGFGPAAGTAYALVSMPFGRGETDEAVSAAVSLDKLQKLFTGDGLVQSSLVDATGMALAHSDPARVGRSVNEPGSGLAPLFEYLAKPDSGIGSGIQALAGPDGQAFYGGFRRVAGTGLAVVSSVPPEEASAPLEGIRHRLIAYLLVVFVALAALRYRQLKRRPAAAAGDEPVFGEPALSANEPSAPAPARRVAVAALHGSLRGLNQLVDASPGEACDALNDFFALAASVVRESGGHFELESGASFGAAWEMEPGVAERAVACCLTLRAELERLNGLREVDGKKPLRYGAGLHVGLALRARLGVAPHLRDSVTGEAAGCARALDRVALTLGRDLVISEPALKSARGVFTGEVLGEARLTSDTGLTACYSVAGFVEAPELAEGRFEPQAAAPADGERMTGGETRELSLEAKREPRWLVNNGSQIVGPLTSGEIARMLFAQELDFDCECWREETGKASRLESAGIFSGGSEDAGACYWVYDGKQIHGPVTEGFIRTAVQHGAFAADAYVCDHSTVTGWRRLADVSPAAA
jgi:class 3 adenylate cyclase